MDFSKPTQASPGIGSIDPIVIGEEVTETYGSPSAKERGDFFGRWRRRSGWNRGSPSLAWLMIATGTLLGGAALLSWQVFE